MKILLDECVPKRLKRVFEVGDVVTVPEMGWAGIKNGELLSLASDNFDVFVTIDQNLRFQQNLDDLNLIVVVLIARNNKVETLRPLIPTMLENLQAAKSGEVIEVEEPSL
jgi:predicted nuclease of predicted toxin-antitoxin system